MTADTKDNKDSVEVKVTEEVELAAASSSAAAAGKHDKDEEVHVEVTEELDPELEKLLQTDPLNGLSDAEVNERLAKFGHNEIPEKKTNPFLKFLSYFVGSIAFLLEVATIMSAVVGKWPEFGILVFVLILNAIIGFVEEARAESALDALKNTLALKTRVWRNGQLVEVDSATLVPGDVIALRLGDIVPADCRLLGIGVTGEETEGALQIDQSALTGESLPVSKKKGSIAFSSSIVKQGQMLAVVTKTGIHTYIGRAANLISITNERGHFQKVIGAIGNFLVIIVLIMVIILMFVLIFARGYGPLEAIVKVLVLTVAAIPVGLPTVLSVTMALGSNQLAKKQVIVKRLTAIEELASVSILCSDKTGTLTLNELTFDNPYLSNKGNTTSDFYGTGVPYTNEDLLLTAYFASEPGAQDAIELAVRTAAEERVEVLRTREGSGHQIPGYKVNGFIPFNPTSKYTEATVTDLTTGKQFRCIKGAPQVIVRMVGGHDEASDAVLNFARRGLRALGVARTVDAEMTKFELVGMISLLDPPRPDSAATIKDCEAYGVRVKMITGDQLIIAKEVAYRLNMNRTILDAGTLADESLPVDVATDRCDKADGFAQVIPEHKYKVVELLQNRGYLVGMTGDGVNDAPALKKANVGIAVAGCTDAARSAADIVLLAHGLSTIVDGIKTSRAIFQRMRSYALYRIASTIHFMVFFFLTILIWEYSLSDSLILMITILNDAATLVISVDNARISKRPDKWRLGQLITLSFVLGIALTIISFAHFFVATYGLGYKITRALDCDHGISDTCDGYLNSFIYLNVSSCPHFVIFSTRLPTWLWKNIPHWIFSVVIIGTQVVAVIMSATGVFGIGFFGAGAIGWGPAILILLVSFVMTFFLDAIKVFVMRYWSFEMTAKLWPSPSRRRELARRKDRVIMLKRYKINIDKLRKVLAMANVIVAFKNAAKKKYISRGASAVDVTAVETIVATEAEPLVKN